MSVRQIEEGFFNRAYQEGGCSGYGTETPTSAVVWQDKQGLKGDMVN